MNSRLNFSTSAEVVPTLTSGEEVVANVVDIDLVVMDEENSLTLEEAAPIVVADSLDVTASGIVATDFVEAKAVVILTPVASVDKPLCVVAFDISLAVVAIPALVPASVDIDLLVTSSGVLASDSVVPEAVVTLPAVVAVSVVSADTAVVAVSLEATKFPDVRDIKVSLSVNAGVLAVS